MVEIKQLSDQMMSESFAKHTQDVYVLPTSEVSYIYFRYDEEQAFWKGVSSVDGQQLISGSRYLGQVDIGEKRRAQLGASTYSLEKQKIWLRLSPVGDYLQRESLVIRLLYGIFETPHRCLNSRDFATTLQKAVRRGLHLFSRSVGSGKTPLMYRLVSKEKRQVITIEDPVEIEEPLSLQLRVNPKITQTHDTLLKLALRHRPNSLIIGEIKDESAAHAAVRAALTGYRIFATVHAHNLEGTLIRIHELIRRKEELSKCLAGVIYQGFLEDADYHPSVLWSYQLMEEEPVKRSWEGSYEEAQKKTWQSKLF